MRALRVASLALLFASVAAGHAGAAEREPKAPQVPSAAPPVAPLASAATETSPSRPEPGARPALLPIVEPSEVPYDHGVPGPRGYTLARRASAKPLTAGAGMLLSGWAVNCMIFTSFVVQTRGQPNGDTDRLAWLLVPVAGPAFALGAFAEGRDTRSQGLAWAGALLSLDLIYQLTATAVLITGLVHKEKVWQKPSLGASLVPDVHAGPGGGTLKWRF